MATLAEELRFKLQNTVKELDTFSKSFEETVPTEDDERKLEAMINGAADLRTELARLSKFQAATGGPVPDGDERPNPAKTVAKPQLITLGQRFTGDSAIESYIKEIAPEGRIPDGTHVNSPRYHFKGLGEFSPSRNAGFISGLSDSSGGAFIVTDRQTEVIPLGRRPLTVLDIIRTLQTGSDLIDYVAQLSRTNAAAIVAEAIAAGDGSGYKPESAFDFVVRSAAVKTIANWITVTKQALADVAQMKGIIDTELKDNLQEALENQVVNGSVASGFVGMLQTSGRQTQAWSSNILTTTRKAKTIVSTVGRTIATAYVLNPTDWETIDLLQDNEARYFYGGPAQVGIPRLWGLPVVESEAVAAGTGITGNFMKYTVWDREQASVVATDSHADYFVRNLIAVLAELRAAGALVQPTAIVEIDTAA